MSLTHLYSSAQGLLPLYSGLLNYYRLPANPSRNLPASLLSELLGLYIFYIYLNNNCEERYFSLCVFCCQFPNQSEPQDSEKQRKPGLAKKSTTGHNRKSPGTTISKQRIEISIEILRIKFDHTIKLIFNKAICNCNTFNRIVFLLDIF